MGLDLRPSLLIRDAKVVGFIPSNSAELRGPEILPFVWAKAARILSRSRCFSSDSVKIAGAGLGAGATWSTEPRDVDGSRRTKSKLNTPVWAKKTARSTTFCWAFRQNRIAVRFAYGWHDDSGHWFRSYGNENWEFREDGLMARRFACINDLPIQETDRKFLASWSPS
jgi:nuclear transport factor 2 (NTF2) superfamily protein